MRISVTQKHIDNGTMRTGNFCPIALALKDAGVVNRLVGWRSFLPIGDYSLTLIKISAECADFMEAYDNGRDVEPFEFDLKLSATCLRP